MSKFEENVTPIGSHIKQAAPPVLTLVISTAYCFLNIHQDIQQEATEMI